MSAWADPEPAWWLNLLAHPDARVDLVDGSGPVRGRAANEDERPRLWARWAVYNEKLDAYAALRSRQTQVVILEPRSEWHVARWTCRPVSSQSTAASRHLAIYKGITGARPEIVGVRLTQAAYAHGLALALPEKVELARPTGVGRAISTYDMHIEGREEWLAAARRLA